MWGTAAAVVEHAFYVDVDHPVPLVDFYVLEKRKRHEAGVVYQNVDCAPLFGDRVDKGVALGLFGDVQSLHHGLAARTFNLFF